VTIPKVALNHALLHPSPSRPGEQYRPYNNQSLLRLLDEAAKALKDDWLGFTLARHFDPTFRSMGGGLRSSKKVL
jgi:hypothetical protein